MAKTTKEAKKSKPVSNAPETDVVKSLGDLGHSNFSFVPENLPEPGENVYGGELREKQAEYYPHYLNPDDERDLILETIRRADLERIPTAGKLIRSDPTLENIYNEVAAERMSAAPPLPDTAPALWSERKTGREVTAVDFLIKHYQPWLYGKGLTLQILGDYDDALKNAYNVRVHRHPEEDLGIPKRTYTKYEDTDLEGAKAKSFYTPTSELSPEQREERRKYSAAQKRKKDDKESLHLEK